MIQIKEEENCTTHKYNEKYHRHEGPAIIWKNSTLYYYVNDRFHRFEGPAYCNINASILLHYINGVFYNDKLFRIKYKPCVLRNGILS